MQPNNYAKSKYSNETNKADSANHVRQRQPMTNKSRA